MDGQTATNPTTGERIILRGGQWVPLSPARPQQRPAPARAQRPQIRFQDDIDALTRTVIGEAGNQAPEGQRAVAAVVLNRARQRRLSPSEVVLERNQFEPWGNAETARGLMSIQPNDPRYVAARREVERAMAGDDPTGGADHFFAPRAQAALGRQVPSWAKGQPTVIGDHNFYKLGGSTEDARVAAAQSAAMPAQRTTATNPQTGEKIELVDGQWVPVAASTATAGPIEVEIDQGVFNRDGRAILDGQDMGDFEAFTAAQNKEQEERERLLARREDPVYQAEYARAVGGAENIPGGLAATLAGQTLGGKGIVPYLTGLVSSADAISRGVDPSIAGQAGRDATRATMDRFAQENPGQNLGFQLIGGLLTPGMAGAGNYVAGARGAERLGRASGVGAAYGAGSGLLNSEGDLGDRAADTLLGAGVGGATAGLLDTGMVRAGQAVARQRAARPSNARLLSREGVDLTPGQMVGGAPVVGPILRGLEEGASSIPFVGAPIAGARQQSVETFNRASLNRVLQPLNETMPRNIAPGYESVEHAQGVISRAYDDVLDNVTFRPNTEFYDNLGRSINQTLIDAGSPQARQLTQQITNRVFRSMPEAGTPITGQQFKALESEFGTLASEALSSSDGASRALGRAYQQVQEAMRSGLREQNPQAAARLRDVNSAYARLMRVETAAASTASQANDGVFTPTQLGQAVGRMGSRRASARGDSLMQDLAVAGRNVIPSRVGDSGTATRGAVTGLLAGLAAGVPIAGTAAIPVVVTSIAYSRPAQALINTIYRATDRGAGLQALAELQRLAARNPALQPYYQAAALHLLPGGEQPAQPSQPGPSSGLLARPETTPAATGLLSPIGP